MDLSWKHGDGGGEQTYMMLGRKQDSGCSLTSCQRQKGDLVIWRWLGFISEEEKAGEEGVKTF